MGEVLNVSVVVPTFNRRASLAALLNSLEQQRLPPPFEVIVVDNNSTDDTRKLLSSFQARRTIRFRYFIEKRPGVSHARNTGVAHAKAAIIGFLDDDIEAAPDWVQVVQRTFDEHPDIDCISGPVYPRWPHNPPPWLTRDHWGVVAIQDREPWVRVDARNATKCLPTENFGCRKEAFDAVGGFDPLFVRNEDRELELRLWSAGRNGLYTPELVTVTNVPAERMTKAYHRKWYARNGHFRAMMRDLERVDSQGQLVGEKEGARRFLGTPLFVYRQLLGHFFGCLGATLTRRTTRAFYHETRLRNLAAYIVTRCRMQYRGVTVRARLAVLGLLQRHLLSHRSQEVSLYNVNHPEKPKR